MTAVKLKPTACRRTLVRRRLLRAVEEQKEKRLVVLCAASGYGKTILLAQLFNKHNEKSQPAVWYAFDSHDNNCDLFLKTINRGVKRLCPSRKGKTVKAVSIDPGLIPEVNHDYQCASFIGKLADSSAVPVSLFFDNFQVVNGSKAITGFIQFLIDHLPDGCRIFIASRERPTISIGRLRAQRAVLEMGNQQLRFTFDETERYINPRYKKNLKQQELEALHSWSDGWPAALSMFRNELKTSCREPAAILSSRKLAHAVDSYFSAETMSVFDNGMRQLLMHSALDDTVRPSTCDLVFSKRKGMLPSRLLKAAEDMNLMVSAGASGEAFEYHPLFRQYLISALEKNAGRAGIISLHRKYAGAYERQNDFERAINHFIKGEAWDQATFLIETRGERMLSAGKVDELGQWLEKIPLKVESGRPWLKFIAARVLARQGEVSKAGRKFISVRNAFAGAGDKAGRHRCLIAESDLLTGARKVRQGLEVAEEALRCAEEPEEIAAAGHRIALNRLFLGATDKIAGHPHSGQTKDTDKAVAVRSDFNQARALLARVYLAGDYKSYLAIANESLLVATRLEKLEEQSRFANEKTTALFLVGRYQDALEAAGESLTYARRLGDKPAEWSALALRGCILLYAGNPVGGIADIKEAIERFKAAAVKTPEYLNHLGNHYRRCGDAAHAMETHRLALEYGKSAQNQYMIAQSLANLGADRSGTDGGKDPHENGELAESMRLARKHGYKYVEMQVYFHRAAHCYRSGNNPKALRHVKDSLELASQLEQNHFFAQEGRVNPDLLAFVYEKGLHRGYLIKIFGIIGPEALPAIIPLVESEDPQVRKQAIAAAGAAGEREAIPCIRRCLKDDVTAVADAADIELSRIRSTIKAPEDILSRRERQVFGLLAKGLSNSEIAKQLFIHEQTVKTHVGKIFDKLGLTKRVQAAAYFSQYKHG